MLHVSFSKIMNKQHVVLEANTLSLPVGKAVVIQGDAKIINRLFFRIFYLNQCTFSLDKEPVAKELLQENIRLLSNEHVLPLTKRVKHLFNEMGYNNDQCKILLRDIHLEDKVNTHIFHLSKEERVLLSLQLAIATQPKLLLIVKDWTRLSVSTQSNIRKLLEAYLSKGNFMMLSQEIMCLDQNSDFYKIDGQMLYGSKQHTTNFLEEKGTIDQKKEIVFSRWKHFRHRFSFLRACSKVVYCVLSTIVVLLILMMIFTVSLEIESMEMHLSEMKSADEFQLKIQTCTDAYKEGEVCEQTNFKNEQLALIRSIEGIKDLSAENIIWFSDDGIMEPIKLIVDGMNVLNDEDTNMFYATILASDISKFSINKQFYNPRGTKKGIYISKSFEELHKEFFRDAMHEEISIQGPLGIPLYTQMTEGRSSYNDSQNRSSRINTITKGYPCTLPILGIVDDDSHNWYIDEQIFADMQKELLAKYPKDSAAINVDFSTAIDDYAPFTYELTIDSFENLQRVKSAINDIDKKIRIDSDLLQQEQFVDSTYEYEVQIRKMTMPILCAFITVLCTFILATYRVEKRATLYTLQRQHMTRRWIECQVGKMCLLCLIIGVVSTGMLCILSFDEVHQSVMSWFMNNSYFSKINIFENIFFRIVAALFRVSITLSTSTLAIVVTFLISLIVGVMRYITVFYWIYKSRKLF